MKQITDHFLEAEKNLHLFNSDTKNFESIKAAGDLLLRAIQSGGKAISCGNGGSLCDAMHFAEEMTGRFKENRQALPAIAIADPSHLSCVANDYGYAYVFSRYVEALGKKEDVLLAISTSGNSENVINAIQAAKDKKMKVIGLTGKDGGKMAELCDVEIRAPFSKYADHAQEIHIKVIHALIDYVERNVL